MKAITQTIALVAAAAFAGSMAFAQTPSSTAPAKPHHGVLSFLHRPKPGSPSTKAPGKPLFAGNIIGNKKTHVYHMPGDRGALPAPQNRVYFRTQAQAIAAGYHRAGTGGRKPGMHMGGHMAGHMGGGHMTPMHH
jgi:hypothetical protein